MPDQAKNMLIGLFVVAACAIIIFLLLFLHPSVGDQGRLLRVRFADIDKISIGTRVNFAGKPVGEVIAIRELSDVETERKAINGYVYVYELTLRVDSGVNVFNTDIVASRTSGLLGERSIAITPGTAKPGETIYLVNKEIIYATETGSVEDALKDVKNVANKISTTLDDVNKALTTLQDQKFWENIGGIAANVNDITHSLNKPEQWSESLSNIHTFTQDLKSSWPKIENTINNLSATASNFKTLSRNVNSNKGTIGKLINQDDLYLRLTSLLSKADTTMNDINHYGVLFHLDKQWQRLRARRMNLLQKLRTPQEFRNYFNDEVDQIQSSLSRVSMILTQYDWQPPYCYYNLLDNPEYTKVFAELMKRISALEEEVRLYNMQVVDTADTETELINNSDCIK
jgi:phospholipid/cholesterol/gamma-HCH transport system substrate-binding protein